MYKFDNLIVEISNGVAVITINRPQEMNALNPKAVDELDTAFQELGKDAAVGAVIITGNDKVFVAGADITSMVEMEPIKAKEWARSGQLVFSRIENFPKVVIAACGGFTLGGGCELAMACDIRVASEKARFGQPEVNLGIMPGFAGTQRLPRLVGKGQAKLLILTGDIISAQEALQIGLIDMVVPHEELLDAAKALARKIVSKAPYAVQQAKRSINRGMEVDIESGAILEAEAFGMCFTTKDQREGMQAFVEKRKPQFSGF
ncbi:enoyl-CoA hydratase [Anaerospora hongkongensis]|uniref:Enoyl-CoA hydratase n=1 Tax=Anaerospora hongkongensis TaxID=244830 RepID=A0A4R1Q2Y4_9FIRM|nr:enoyl-CoA hydratase-related protein [Anaerospora hongkongensis]TCL38868.1 enoyl-CoA hydratase [Anaerospora hongkongensis]